MKHQLILGLLLTSASAVQCQPDTSLRGDWTAKFAAANGGRPAQAQVKIGETESSWQSLGSSLANACIGRKFPMTVVSSGTNTVTLTVTSSKVMVGCDDIVLELKRVNPTTLEGQFPDGRAVTVGR